MAAGAAMAVVGWWSGYKLGGVIALFTAEYFQNIGIINYWQSTFLILGVVVILMNIGLMFVHETHSDSRKSIFFKKTYYWTSKSTTYPCDYIRNKIF